MSRLTMQTSYPQIAELIEELLIKRVPEKIVRDGEARNRVYAQMQLILNKANRFDNAAVLASFSLAMKEEFGENLYNEDSTNRAFKDTFTQMLKPEGLTLVAIEVDLLNDLGWTLPMLEHPGAEKKALEAPEIKSLANKFIDNLCDKIEATCHTNTAVSVHRKLLQQCNAYLFYLDYQAGDDQTKTLGSWSHKRSVMKGLIETLTFDAADKKNYETYKSKLQDFYSQFQTQKQFLLEPSDSKARTFLNTIACLLLFIVKLGFIHYDKNTGTLSLINFQYSDTCFVNTISLPDNTPTIEPPSYPTTTP